MASITITQYRSAIGGYQGKLKCNTPCIPSTYFKFSHLFRNDYLFQNELFCRKKEMNVQVPNNAHTPGKLILHGIIATSILICMLLMISGSIHPNLGPGMDKSSDISICHVNIRSLCNKDKIDHISCELGNKFNIITISETWLKSTSDPSILQLKNFQTPFRKDRQYDQGYGGVLAWVSNDLVAKRRNDLELESLEAMWLEIRSCNKIFLLCTVYRPPNSRIEFWNDIEITVGNAKETGINYIILSGDFNADPKTEAGHKLAEFATANNLMLHIHEPTRVTPNTSSVLDQFITNSPNFVLKAFVEPPVSNNDHCTIGLELKFSIHKKKSYKRLMWDFNGANFNNFRAGLMATDFSFCDSIINVEEACTMWTKLFLDVAKERIPNKIVTIRPNDKSWFNGYLRRLLRTKNRSHHKAKKTNTPENWAKFRADRNRYINESRRCKLEYESDKFSSIINSGVRNSKKWWTLLKGVLGQTQANSQIVPLDTNEFGIVVDDKLKADVFNNYFSSVSQIDESTAVPLDDNIILDNHNQLSSIEIDVQEVRDLLSILDVNKAYGPDAIPPILLKEGAPVIADSLCKIFNASLDQKTIPTLWKEANVLSLFKKGSASDVGNYRPVSLLSSVSKILERIVFKHVFNHFRDNFLLTVHQSGFLPGHSTITQLVELHHSFCKAISDNKEIRVVFLDISKAFDRVWHNGLIYKLRKFGIAGPLLNWFVDYLHNRKQRVIVSGQYSDWASIKAGVPQGSVLGPLLFLVFINDIVHVTHHCQIKLFADDTCMFLNVDNRIDAAQKMNQDLICIQNWANRWLVNFSPPKTEALTISNKLNVNEHPKLFLNGHTIKEVQTHKHLGMILSHDLKWNKHIGDLCVSCRRRLDLLRALKYKLDRRSLETIYMNFIRPKMEYGDVLFVGASFYCLEKLNSIQNEAMRIVCGATARSSLQHVLAETGWQTLHDRRQIHCLCLLYTIVNSTAPDCLSGIF